MWKHGDELFHLPGPFLDLIENTQTRALPYILVWGVMSVYTATPSLAADKALSN